MLELKKLTCCRTKCCHVYLVVWSGTECLAVRNCPLAMRDLNVANPVFHDSEIN